MMLKSLPDFIFLEERGLPRHFRLCCVLLRGAWYEGHALASHRLVILARKSPPCTFTSGAINSDNWYSTVQYSTVQYSTLLLGSGPRAKSLTLIYLPGNSTAAIHMPTGIAC